MVRAGSDVVPLAPRERFGYTTMEILPCGRIIALEGGAAAASTPDSKGV